MIKTSRRAKGEGSLYQRKSDGMFIGTVDLGYDGAGKRRRPTVSSRDYATVVAKLRALRRAADESDLTTSTLTVETWLTHWLDNIASGRIRPRTLTTYRGYARRYIIPALGKRRLSTVTPQQIRAMHAAILAKGCSPTTARQAHAILVKAFSDARREGHVALNIGDRMDPPRKDTVPRSALTVPQAITMLRSVEDAPLGSRWAAALLMGARQGECLGLEWDRVDLEGATVDLAWQLQRLQYRHGCGPRKDDAWPCGLKRAGSCPSRELDVPRGFEHRPVDGGLVLTRPKSRAGQRVVPLVPSMVRALAKLPHRHGLVWTRPDGRPIDPRDDSAAWHDVLEAAKLPSVPLHAVRHTTATLLRQDGVDMPTIERIMGHASAAVTMGYLHDDLTLSRRALESLDRRLAGSAVHLDDGRR